MSTYDVVIIGGGVVGCALARELSQFQNLKVVVLETFAEVGFGTSKANSGIVHPGHHDKPGTVKASLVVRGNQLIDELAKELGFGYRRCGEVMVAKTEEEFDELKALMVQAKEQKVPVELWDQATLREKEPHLSKELVGGVYAPTAGVVSPYEMVHSLAAVAARNGVEFLFEQEVVGIDQVAAGAEDGARMVVKTAKGLEVRTRFVVNAAGLFSDKVAEMVGLHDFVIKPRKGEEYLLDKNMSYVTKRVILPVPTKVSKGILIIPTVDETIMCGPTAVDTDDRYDLTCTPEGCQTIFSFVSKMCTEINDRQVIASFAGLRAAANTGDFIIGPTAVKGFINAAGIQSPGLTSAPAIAERLVEILGKEGLPCVARAAGEWKRTVPAPRRLFSMTEEEQDRKVRENPAFGRVVCRCELVTEGDIEEAIEYGARTLDGVKFRTRAGMGRCQGGFCTSRIVQMLAEHQKVTLDKITKRGTGSEILDDECLNRKPAEQPDCIPPAPVHIPDETHVVDVAIIGGGPAGLAAGLGARKAGAGDVLVFDREDSAGGILNQCIHSGFGLHYFQEELTGPEYAQRFLMQALEAGVRICTSSYVVDVATLPSGDKKLRVLIGGQGLRTIVARSVVIATGCRERPRAAIKIPGSRPAGVFTAGLAQKFVNVYGHLPGKNIVILGSGDIGLIMARRMTLEHCNVLGVFEILPTCNGLKRNVVQCLEDYKIPLHLSHTVVAIHGKDHVEGVTVAPCDPQTLKPDMSKAYDIKCDCLLLSVGLIPENEISRHMGVQLHPRTNGPVVNSSLETNVPGVFACGNALQVHDLVDNVSAEGLAAGRAAARFAQHHDGIKLVAGQGIGYILPASINAEQDQTISFRVRSHIAPAIVRLGSLYTTRLPFCIPSEMVRIDIPKAAISRFLQEQLHSDNFPVDGTLTVSVDVVEDKETEEKERKEREAAAAAAAGSTKEGQSVVELTCICCPHGCALRVVKEGDKVVSVSGNTCSRGAAFGEQEVVDPRRVFSTTVPIEGAICGKIPVKLTQQFPKDRLIEAAYEIQKLRLKAPVTLGQVLIKDLLGEKGCDVVACRTLEPAEKESDKYNLGAEYLKKLEQEKDAAAGKPAEQPKKEGAKDTLRLLPVLGSVHANGNTAKMMASFISGAQEAAQAKGVKLEVAATLNVARKKISPCTYCMACTKKPAPGCIIKDDMPAVMDQVLSSDIVVHGVPVWFWGMPAQFKSYLDRYTQLYTREWAIRDEIKERTNGLTFAAIATCGDDAYEKTTSSVVSSLEALANFTPGWKWAGAAAACSAPAVSDEALARAAALGKAAVEKALSA